MKDAFGNYYNRVQIYLDNETFRKFEQLCLEKGSPKSKVGGWILAEYFRTTESQPSQTNSDTNRTESLQSQIDELRKIINRLESKFDSVMDTELEITRTDSVSNSEEFSYSTTEFSNPRTANSMARGFVTREGKTVKETGSEPILPFPEISSSTEHPDIKQNQDLEPEIELQENIPLRATKKLETKAQKAVSRQHKQKPYIPKDLQRLNEAGGIQITEGTHLSNEVLDKYFAPLLQGRYVLRGVDEQDYSYWICGGRHPKILEDYVQVKLYHLENRMKIAIPKLEEKFSITITSQPAIDFLRELPSQEREQMISNWGIEFTFVD